MHQSGQRKLQLYGNKNPAIADGIILISKSLQDGIIKFANPTKLEDLPAIIN